MFDLVLKNGNLITMNNNDEILYNKDLFIKDGKIVAIKETSNKNKYRSYAERDWSQREKRSQNTGQFGSIRKISG